MADMDPEQQQLEEQLTQRIMQLLPQWIKTINLEPNSIVFVNANKVDMSYVAAAIQAMAFHGLSSPMEHVYIIGVNGQPEASLMTKAELENALKILNGEVA